MEGIVLIREMLGTDGIGFCKYCGDDCGEHLQKRDEQRVVHEGKLQLQELGDRKVVSGENVGVQHQMVDFRMTLDITKRKKVKVESRMKWWKSKKEECFTEFREELRPTLGGREELSETKQVGEVCFVHPLDRRMRTRRFRGGMRKYKKVFKGRG